AGEEAQDRFALAVVIFQLLNFGIHPFSGRPANGRVPTDLPGRIRGRYYAYGLCAHKAITPNPVSGHAQMPQELREMFDSAFGGQPGSRPAPAEWARVLREYALRSSQRLAVCTADPSHQHFAGLACAACARSAMIAGAASAAAAAGATPVARAGGKRKSGRGKRTRQVTARPPLQQPFRQPLAQAAAVSASISTTMPASGGKSGTPVIAFVVAVTLLVLAVAFVSSGGGDSDREAATPAAASGTSGGQGQPLEWTGSTGISAPYLRMASTRAEIRATIAAVAAGQFYTYRYNLLRLRRMGLPQDHTSYYIAQEFDRIQRTYRDTLRRARTAATRPEGGARAAEAELEVHYDQHREFLARESGAFYSANELGEYHLLLKEPVAARLLFEQAIWARANDPNAWYGLGAVALHEQRDKDAVASFAIAERLQAEAAGKSGELSAFLATLRLRMVSDTERWETFSQAGKALAALLANLPPAADRQASVDPASQQHHPAIYPATMGPGAPAQVDLQVTVDASGDPIRITVVRLGGPEALGRAAIEAARKWRYQPAVRKGELIEGIVMIPVSFEAG
ncbi:TonB family protein, partial [Cupriavidus basilensis]|uniref:TonB family protein n=1 Tax=Cupriavidus basilensis TaxID=68895 RepID=UPI0020A693B2